MRTRLLYIAFFSMFLYTSSVYAQPELDVNFNATGKVTTDFTAFEDRGNDVVIQPDNKIIVVGSSGLGNSPAFALVRHNADGSLDASFGIGGRVTTDFDTGLANEGAAAAAIQTDGKIIAAGYTSVSSPGPGFFALVRYNTDGSIDTSFGTGGRVTTRVGSSSDQANAIALQSDGKIVVAGSYFDGSNIRTALVRYNNDGSLDASFGSGGIVTTAIGGGTTGANAPNSVAIQSDGKIVTGGYSRTFGSGTVENSTVVRYNANGSLDITFDGDGIAIIPMSTDDDRLFALAVQPDGKIVSAGFTSPSPTERDFALVRFNPNGSLDSSFDGDGKVTTSLEIYDAASGVTLRPNGKIIAGGTSRPATSGGAFDFALVLYNADGSLDTTFSGDGKLTFDFAGSSRDIGNAVAVDGLGRIVLAGQSNNSMFAAARLYATRASVSGRILTPSGSGLSNAIVQLADQSGATQTARTSSFGYFRFENVPTGQSYIVSVRSKRFTFNIRTIDVFEELTDIDFVANPPETGLNFLLRTVTK